MVTALLVNREVTDAARLLEALEKQGVQVSAAMWTLWENSGERRLLIATPLVDERGPFSTYLKVQTILQALFPKVEISLSNISVLSPNHLLIKHLRKYFRGRVSEKQPIFSRITIDTEYGDYVYIYKL